MRPQSKIIAASLSFAIVLAACATPTTPPPAPTATQLAEAAVSVRNLAVVESITVTPPDIPGGSATVQVNGTLPDNCTTLEDSVNIQLTGQVFAVTLSTTRPANRVCAAQASPFEKTVTLNTANLTGGDYVVVVNGASGALKIPGEPTATPEPTPTPVPATATPAASTTGAQPTIAPTLPPTVAPTANANCIDKAAFDSDVTVPDNTTFKQGVKFTKTWRIRNAGTCAWKGYKLVFASGDQMSAAQEVPLTDAAPGEFVNVSVEMTAPKRGGSQTGNWLFKNAAGQTFGLGAERSSFLWVTIFVDFGNQPVAGGGGTSTGGTAGGGASAGCGSVSRSPDFENTILALVNQARTSRGLLALNLNSQLSEAAWRHSKDMGCNDFTSHNGSDGTNWYDRVRAQGFANYNSARENIYAGNVPFGADPQGTFNWWINSQIHRDNILFPTTTDIGVAVAYNPNTQYAYYTLIVARAWGN
jgi:uncharacterized protein YkwD